MKQNNKKLQLTYVHQVIKHRTDSRMIQHLNTFLEILNEPPSFDDDDTDNDDSTNTTSTNNDENACEGLLKEFTDDEKMEIANVSYAFWIVNLKANERLSVDGQRNSALKEIRRHYVGENRDLSLIHI